MNAIEAYIRQRFREQHPEYEYDTTGDVYLTHCGSCIETGDEGVVGRGNRIGGLIRVNRPMSMEGICGKNPVYHTGKVLAGAAYEILNQAIGAESEEATIYLVGQRGRSLERPWKVVLEGREEFIRAKRKVIVDAARATLSNLYEITIKFIKREIRLC